MLYTDHWKTHFCFSSCKQSSRHCAAFLNWDQSREEILTPVIPHVLNCRFSRCGPMAEQCLTHGFSPATSPPCSELFLFMPHRPACLGFHQVNDFADKLGDLFFFFISKPCYLCQPSDFSPKCCLEFLSTFAFAKLLVKMSQAKIGIEE